MKTFVRPALAAALVLLLAACASPSGQSWTPPPVPTAAPETAAPESIAPASVPPASQAASPVASAVASPAASQAASPVASVAASPAASAGASGAPAEGRVIELELTAALEIKEDGVKVTDIPVTPGETVIFKLTNTAGYIHNFYIGPDQALMTGAVTGLVGLPEWSDPAPVELTWTVPDDITGLKFGCTVAGHYMLMNGTFSVAP